MDEEEEMSDKIGNMPKPKTHKEALMEIRKISADKRGHVMLKEHCDWLELKLKAISIMANRGIRLK